MFNVTNIRPMCGISDSHNIISVAVKGDAPPPKHRKMKYKSFKNFHEDAFSEAVRVAPFEVAYVFDDVDDIYWAHKVLRNRPTKGECANKRETSKKYMMSLH